VQLSSFKEADIGTEADLEGNRCGTNGALDRASFDDIQTTDDVMNLGPGAGTPGGVGDTAMTVLAACEASHTEWF
jgi:hypothetical protein